MMDGEEALPAASERSQPQGSHSRRSCSGLSTAPGWVCGTAASKGCPQFQLGVHTKDDPMTLPQNPGRSNPFL